MDYTVERENNIVKNIAKDIVIECTQIGVEATQELAECMVKLKLLNPKNGFTASEVMPRSLTQQLVMLVTEDLKQDTPAMNCIRMQVYWGSVKMNVADLKKEYFAMCAEKGEQYMNDLVALQYEDWNKMYKIFAFYILSCHNLGNTTQFVDVRETVAAIQSVFKSKDVNNFFNSTHSEKIEKIKDLVKLVTGIRLYLKFIGKAGEGVQEVNNLPRRTEGAKRENFAHEAKVTSKIEDIREVISNIVPMDYIMMDIAGTPQPVVENLPPDCDENDLKYLKQVLTIMIQHRIYLSDISSKLDEIDADSGFFLKEFQETLERLYTTIRDREAVPKTDVFDEFEKVGEMWMEIQSYLHCLDVVEEIMENLVNINKKEHFAQTTLEKAFTLRVRVPEKQLGRKKSDILRKAVSSSVLLKDTEDFHIEYNAIPNSLLTVSVEKLQVKIHLRRGNFSLKDEKHIIDLL